MKKELYECKIQNRKDPVKGSLLMKNNNLVCVAINPVDYVIDGLMFINKKKVDSISLYSDKTHRKIMLTKINYLLIHEQRYNMNAFVGFNELFTYLKKEIILCELSLSKEEVFYVGKLINVYSDYIDIDFYDTKFKIMDKAIVYYDDITSVSIFSDYIDTFDLIINKR